MKNVCSRRPVRAFAPRSFGRASSTAAVAASSATCSRRPPTASCEWWVRARITGRDLGELYLLLTASATASGVYHANDECDEQVNDIVAAIAGHVSIRPSIRKVPLPEARKKMGAYADALALDQIVRCPRARALGWTPSLHAVSRNAARLFEEWRRGREAA